MRAGSTSLYRYIGAHPGVYMAPKELQFFTDHFEKGLGWYCDQFAEADPGCIAGEATADYLARQSAMDRIAATLPHAKLVASLRDPIARTYSHYGLLAARGRDDRGFAEAIDMELAALAAHGDHAPGVTYIAHSMFDVHLERALSLFGRDQLFVSIFERMAADPEAIYAALCRFLGVDDTFVPDILGAKVNPYVTFRSLRVRDMSRRLPSPLGRVVGRLNTKRGAPQPSPDAATVARLRDFFSPRIDRIETLLGEAIPEWR